MLKLKPMSSLPLSHFKPFVFSLFSSKPRTLFPSTILKPISFCLSTSAVLPQFQSQQCNSTVSVEPHHLSCCLPHRKGLKIAVLVSGGVDSSVALRLLHAAGHSCTAFYLKIWFQVCFF